MKSAALLKYCHIFFYFFMSLKTACLNAADQSRDALQTDEERRVAVAPAEKDYPCILLTLVIIYLLHIIFALLWLSQSRFWLCCKAIALLHRRGIYCTALLEIQMYYYEAAMSGCLYGGDVPASYWAPLLTHTHTYPLHPFLSSSPPPGIPLYGGYNCCCKFCRSPTPLS